MSNIIECENLVKIYKTEELEVLALQGLELTVEEGELMAVIGNSGSGKSTFLNMIGGLDRPSAGRLVVDGKDLFKLTPKELVEYKRHTVGFVWQNNARNLLPFLTAEANVELPVQLAGEKGSRERARELLELVGLSERRKNRMDQLSGGEQQRVAIAIALAARPRILLADEPTGNLDVRTAAKVLDVFREVNRTLGTTVIIVTHDQLLAKKVNRVVTIRDGKISSERIMKEHYRERLRELGSLADQEIRREDETQDEFVVLDRAGRLQLPREMLERLALTERRLKISESPDGKILLEKPEEKAAGETAETDAGEKN